MITAASPSTIAPALPGISASGDGAQKASPPAPTSVPSPTDPKVQAMRDAIVKLEQVGASTKAARTGAAMAKLEALKQRLKMLMMLGGDPKTVAKQAAQIAKEIGEAAKEYAAAGGGAAAAGQASASASAPQTAAPAADSGAASGDATQATGGQAGSQTPGATPTAAPSASDRDPKSDPKSADTPAAQTTSQAGPSAPDSVIAEAKTLAARAKALLKAAIERAKREHADPAEFKDDQDKLSVADKDIDDAARTVSAAAAPASYSASGQAVPAPVADPTPSVSVQA